MGNLSQTPHPAKAPGIQKQQSTKPTTTTFDSARFSTTNPASIWVIVNKQHPLSPQSYTPADLRFPNVSLRIPGATEMQLRAQPAAALETMFTAAQAAGQNLQVTTAFRGYEYQKTLYDGYVATQGQAEADTQSARPGYSEHQTGLAADIRPQSGTCYLEACFGTTPEGVWLATNAYKYGFIIRYPVDKTAITGYSYEPWHIRYIGVELSQKLHDTNTKTLEEFFGVKGGADYISPR